jgi:lactoylglutathione lyase/methylmalonyl-CoA/ethylmalonyl-CoA epimerase
MRIKRIHHLTIAVRDENRAAETFEALFGAGASAVEDVPAFGVRTRDVPIGDGVLQVASPLEQSGPVSRFIERKGEGFYNLALEVDDLGAAVAELRTRGIKASDPIEATPGVRSSFVTMTATHGLSVQLVELVVQKGHSDPRASAPAVAPDDDQPSAGRPADADNTKLLDLTPDEWSDEE